VNIKMAFSQEMAKGKITRAKRDTLLASMTDDVAKLVLKDNILQTQALTVTQAQGVSLIESQGRLMHTLERLSLLNRAIEFLPSDKQMAELKANRKGLTRPELSVLLAYSKMVLYKELLDSSLPDEPYFVADLNRYFPKLMQKEFAQAIASHPLKREIIATVVTNSMVNRAGITFFFDIAEDTGLSARDIASAYTLARDVFGLRDLWKGIEDAEKVSVATKGEMMGAITSFLERTTLWLLRNLPLPLDIERVYREIAPGVAEMEKNIPQLHSTATREAALGRLHHLKQEGVPVALAERLSNLEVLSSSFDIIAVAGKTGRTVPVIGKVYFDLGLRLAFSGLREGAVSINTSSHWERLAVQSITADLYDEQRRLTLLVMETTANVEGWVASHADAIKRYEHFITDLRSGDAPDIAKLMVALRHIRELN
jgi:glutamate dehydrogenase